MTLRQFIGQVRGTLNSWNLDDYIPNKLIILIGQSYADLFIKQDADNRKLLNSLNNITVYDCFALEDYDFTDCSNLTYQKCKSLKRSVKKLPELYVTNTNFNLIVVTSVDRSVVYTPTNILNYANILNRQFKSKTKYFWIENGYLIIPDSDIEQVAIYAYSKPIGLIDTKNKNNCFNYLDQEFKIPSYLVANVIKYTLQDLANYNKRMIKDENSNLNTNIKSA